MAAAVAAVDCSSSEEEPLLPSHREVRKSVLVERLRGPHASQPDENDPEIVTLYHGYKDGFLNCIFSSKVRVLCEMCGVRYRIVDIDLNDKPEWFVTVSPKEEVPVAYVKGELLQDSSDILAAVKALVMEDGVGRPDAREFVQREPLLRAEAVGGVMGSFFGYFVSPPGSEGEAASRAKWDAAMGEFEAALGSSDYLCGSSLGPADVVEFPLIRLCPDILELSHGWRGDAVCPRLLAWIDRVTEELDWALGGLADQAHQVECALSGLSKKMPNAVHVSEAAERARAALALPEMARESVLVERLRGPHASQPDENDPEIVTLYHGYKDGYLMCLYSIKVRWMAEELGVRYRIVDIDLNDKPEWFVTVSPKLQCPAACIHSKYVADSSSVISSLFELAGEGDTKYPEFASRESYCSIDAVSADRAVSEMGAFTKFVLTPPGSVDAAAAQFEWEQSVDVFERCFLNSGKPFLCGDLPGRLDAEVMFWRTALPLVELAVGWKSAEKAPFMTRWVEIMENLDSMARAMDGAAQKEALVADKLRDIAEQFPMGHLKEAAQRAQELVGPSDAKQALMRKVQSFCNTVDINDNGGHEKVVLQFVKSAFMEQVKKTQPRRHYTLEEWEEDVLASMEHKKMILQSMVASVVFKLGSLQGDTTNAVTPWMRAAQDGCVLALVELHGNHPSAKALLTGVEENRQELLQLGLIGIAIPGGTHCMDCMVLGPDDDEPGDLTAIFPEVVVFDAVSLQSDDKQEGEEDERSRSEATDELAPLSVHVHSSPARTTTLHQTVRLSPADNAPNLAAFCAQPSEKGTTKQRNPTMATRRTSKLGTSPSPPKSRKPTKLLKPTGKTVGKAGGQMDGGSTKGKAASSVNRRASVAVGASAAWKRAGNAVKAKGVFSDNLKVKRESKEKAVMHVASSRQMNRWHPKNWYFLLLEVGWLQLVAIFCGIYAAVWVINLSFSLLAAQSMTNPDEESTFFVAAWMTISNLVAVGYTGSIGPDSFATFSLGIIQQLQGILLQAFLFSVAVTRFQMPQADLILSDNLLFTNRFHIPFLIFRIGNLRCNMIYNRTHSPPAAATIFITAPRFLRSHATICI